jgi:asparagine synthase (glutamine-hydrolysing)
MYLSSILIALEWGFSIPLSQWLKTDTHYLVEEYLSPKSVNDTGLMNYAYVKELIDRWMGKRRLPVQ